MDTEEAGSSLALPGADAAMVAPGDTDTDEDSTDSESGHLPSLRQMFQHRDTPGSTSQACSSSQQGSETVHIAIDGDPPQLQQAEPNTTLRTTHLDPGMYPQNLILIKRNE